MNVTLQKHGAKHIYKVPEGLRELCTDISREVLRLQPTNLYDFIAEYVDTLLITRENTKIAVKVVNNILLGSQAILSILYSAGFTLEQIAVAAPRIQRAFREYLDAVDMQPVQICEDFSHDDKSMISIRSILEATGATREDAEQAATVIQAAFRGHYERMVLNEAQGKVQWQRAVANTLDILKKAGASQAEISKAVGHLKFAYRGYYTRRNQRIDAPGTEYEPLKEDERILEPAEAIQAVAWMDMMYEDSGLTMEKANEAAAIIQRAYKQYRTRRRCYDVQKVESTKSLIVEAILDTVRHMVFEKVISREDIPTEYGTREEMITTSSKVELSFKEHLRKTRLSAESFVHAAEYDDEEEQFEDEEMEEVAPEEPHAKPETDHMEEQAEEEPVTEEPVAEEPVAEEAKAEEATPEEATAEEAKAEEATPEEAKAEEATPEEATAEEATPEEATAEEAKAEEAKPEEAELKEEEKTEKETEEQQKEEAGEAEMAEEEPNVAQETSGTAGAPAE